MNTKIIYDLVTNTKNELVRVYSTFTAEKQIIISKGITLLTLMENHINDPSFFLKYLKEFFQYKELSEVFLNEIQNLNVESLWWLYHIYEVYHSQDVEGQQG